jgi:hypothetical protein
MSHKTLERLDTLQKLIGIILGEPDALKGASPVRRGEVDPLTSKQTRKD